jgi:hypothetical protein
MARTTRPADPRELDNEPAIPSYVVLEREPDADVPKEELAWWLHCRERAELRAELALAGLL